MTEYQIGFLSLMAQRDMMYVQLFFIVAVGLFICYRFLRGLFKLALGASLLVFAAAWLWGMWQLL